MPALLTNMSCVAVRNRAILIEGAPGSGKSSLALALIDRGGVLVGDDGLRVEHYHGHPYALAPPNTAGKLEIRNIGMVEMPTTWAPIALILSLDKNAPRFPLTLAQRIIEGISIPCLPFYPGDAVQAIRAEYALTTYGIPLPSLPAHHDISVS